MHKLKNLLLFAAIIVFSNVYGQEIRNLSNYPYAIGFVNPAYVASNGQLELDLNFRKQWTGIQGSPDIGSLLLQIPVSNKLSLGLDLGNDKRGLLNTFHGEGIFGYKINLSSNPSTEHLLGFGLTFGVGKTTIDTDQIDNMSDPVLANIADNSFNLEGKFGLFYRINKIDIGFALPKLFRPNYSSMGFGEINLEPLKYTYTFVRMNFTIGESLRLEPWLSVRTYENLKPDYEVLALLHIRNVLSVGGSYRIDNGPTFYVGFNINRKVKSSYSYELSNNQVPGFSQGTHEFQVALILKDNNFDQIAASPDEDEPEAEEPEEELEEVVEPAVEVVVDTAEIAIPAKEVEKTPVRIPEPVVEVDVTEEIETPAPTPAADPLDFAPGHYLVVGVFRSETNAKGHIKSIIDKGYTSFLKKGNDSNMYYVILEQNSDVRELRNTRDRVRKITDFNFQNAWILSIE